jgi:hypothetical protein
VGDESDNEGYYDDNEVTGGVSIGSSSVFASAGGDGSGAFASAGGAFASVG